MAAGRTPDRTPGRTGERAQATRNTLIELAADLFAQHGYVQTSIRDIARRGALTSGAIYGHFRNKADLLVAAISKRTTEELEEQSIGVPGEPDYVETLTRLANDYATRRQLRALIVQGAAAAQTDAETRDSLQAEQLGHINVWVDGYEQHRERLGIDPAVDLRTFVIQTWAVELGLGVLEALGIEPSSPEAWADISRRFGESLKLPPADDNSRPRRDQSR